MSSRKLRDMAGRRGQDAEETDVSALDHLILEAGNEAYNDDNGQLKARREAIERAKELETALSLSLVPNQDGTMSFLNFRMSRTQLIAPEQMTDLEFDALGYMLKGMDNAVQFWIGDWANLCVHPEMNQFEASAVYADIAAKFSLNKKTLQNYASVCRNLDASLRREALGFSIHREIAELPDSLKGQESYFLDWAETNLASVADLKKHIAEKLAETKPSNRTQVTEDSFLFSKSRVPKISRGLQAAWSEARNGNKTAAGIVRSQIEQYRRWLNELEESLGD